MITITLTTGQAIAALDDLARRIGDASPLMEDIGETLTRSTKERIKAGGPAPDGTAYAPKSHVTVANYIRKREGVNTTPLNHLGDLFRQISPESGADFVEISATVVYAAVMQFGAGKGQFGKTSRRGPIPWGNIPARPFLGISPEDERNIEIDVEDYLSGAFTRYAD